MKHGVDIVRVKFDSLRIGFEGFGKIKQSFQGLAQAYMKNRDVGGACDGLGDEFFGSVKFLILKGQQTRQVESVLVFWVAGQHFAVNFSGLCRLPLVVEHGGPLQLVVIGLCALFPRALGGGAFLALVCSCFAHLAKFLDVTIQQHRICVVISLLMGTSTLRRLLPSSYGTAG